MKDELEFTTNRDFKRPLGACGKPDLTHGWPGCASWQRRWLAGSYPAVSSSPSQALSSLHLLESSRHLRTLPEGQGVAFQI